MSGPTEPYRSRSLSKVAAEREQVIAFGRLTLRARGIRTTRDVPEGVAPIEPRETRQRDRSLNGKARIAARRAS